MNPSSLEILLQEGERTLLEYKESLSASFARELVALAQAEAQVKAQAEAQEELTSVEKAILGTCQDRPQTSQELLAALGLTRSGSFKKSLSSLLSSGLIELTLPEKPRSPKQRYRITPLGNQVLTSLKG